MYFFNFGRFWFKIYFSNGIELYNYDGCDYNDYRVFGEIVEVFFEGLDFLIFKFCIDC